MPRYCYRCDSCGQEQEVRHGMSERLDDCSECTTTNSLVRIPQLTYKLDKKPVKETSGTLVVKNIEENRELLKQMRKEGRLDDFD